MVCPPTALLRFPHRSRSGRKAVAGRPLQLRRVLRPGGTLALAYQQREHMPPAAVTTLTLVGARLYDSGDVEHVVRAAGFENLRLETRQTSTRRGGCCLLAVK